MAITYEPIVATTLSSAQSSVTFSSISGSYTDLVLVSNLKVATGTKNVVIRFNSDTGTNYSWTALSGSGSTTYSDRGSNQSKIYLDYVAYTGSTLNANNIVSINNYSNTTTYKTTLSRANNASYGVDAVVGLWRSTSAITSIEIFFDQGGNIDTNSTFTLYGILKA